MSQEKCEALDQFPIISCSLNQGGKGFCVHDSGFGRILVALIACHAESTLLWVIDVSLKPVMEIFYVLFLLLLLSLVLCIDERNYKGLVRPQKFVKRWAKISRVDPKSLYFTAVILFRLLLGSYHINPVTTIEYPASQKYMLLVRLLGYEKLGTCRLEKSGWG